LLEEVKREREEEREGRRERGKKREREEEREGRRERGKKRERYSHTRMGCRYVDTSFWRRR